MASVRELDLDVLLTDIVMPEVSGWDLIELARKRDKPMAVVADHWEEARAWWARGTTGDGVAADVVHLRAPVPRPGAVFAVGIN